MAKTLANTVTDFRDEQINVLIEKLVLLVYVDVGNACTDTAVLGFAFNGASTARTFDIKVSQIQCNSNFE